MNKVEAKKTVKLEEAKEQVKRVCRRLALLHLSYAKIIINELGDKKGRKLILKAIKDYGIRIGKEVKRTVSEQGLDNSPENYKEDLPLYGMHDGIKKVDSKREKKMRAYGCIMGKLWKELNEDKIGRFYCYVDPAKYMVFNSNYKLIHTKTILDGDDYCEFMVKHTTEQEREDFFEEDKDWSYIDK